MGLTVLSPPSSEASKIEVLRDLWTRAGLDAVETRDITVQRTFPDFEDFWTISLSAPSMRSVIAATAPNDIELLKARVRARLPVDATGRITYSKRSEGPCAELAECPLWVISGHRIVALDVRFTPESGHQFSALGCLLCAKSGHK